jgi:hypothetical protein
MSERCDDCAGCCTFRTWGERGGLLIISNIDALDKLVPRASFSSSHVRKPSQ